MLLVTLCVFQRNCAVAPTTTQIVILYYVNQVQAETFFVITAQKKDQHNMSTMQYMKQAGLIFIINTRAWICTQKWRIVVDNGAKSV